MKVFGIAGWKNSGKTTLAERLVAEFARRGLAVSTLKHAHHDFDIDQPGKDSHRHREAGARQVLLASSRRWALMTELHGRPEPKLDELLPQLQPVDLVLVEGFKAHPHPKIELRAGTANDGTPALPGVVAIATDQPGDNADLPEFHRDDITGIADFILQVTGLARRRRSQG